MAAKTARRPAARKPAPRRAPAKAKKRSDQPSIPRRAARHLKPWARDALGIGLIVLAMLAVLGLWLDSGGPFGDVVDYTSHAFTGIAAVVMPVVAAYWGVLLLRGTAEDDRIRMVLGFAILLCGALGILSLLRLDPSPTTGYSGVHDSGGLIGAVVAWPLSKIASQPGAMIICAGMVVLGLLVFTGTPLSHVVRSIVNWFKGPVIADDEDDDVVVVDEPRLQPRVTRGPEDEDEPHQRTVAPVVTVPEAESAAPSSKIRFPTPGKGGYRLPPLDLLRRAPEGSTDTRDEEHTVEALERTFRTFGVAASVPAAHRGPTVTMYEVEVELGTKVNRVLSLADDIAYALATPDVRIIAPIPGRSAIGVEVPNKVRDFVMLGDVLRSKAAKEARHPLTVGLGKDVHGRAVMVNLSEMPHILIAGATGAGKSSLINSFLTSLLCRVTPDEVKLVLIDPKRVELSHFHDLPHLLSPMIVHPKRTAKTLS
ncbi:MAG TPA: DNA translocase FtsK 4TM domain-containing protein, partial [Actinomycetota bacterium]|nr:DNA translocase FtsK 4TM domain-containing protein [Actinomycetota bacterium]